MGDDDVICLSSDDETTAESLPKKRKIKEDPAENRLESALRRDKNIKRKTQLPIGNASSMREAKRPRCSVASGIEKVTIVSSQKSNNVNSNCRTDVSQKLSETGTAESTNSSMKKLSKSDIGGNQKPMFTTLKSTQENCKPDLKQVSPMTGACRSGGKSNFERLEVSMKNRDKEKSKMSFAKIPVDKSQDKNRKSFATFNNPHLVRSMSPNAVSLKKSSDKSISRGEINSMNVGEDKKKNFSLSFKVRATPEASSTKVQSCKTLRQNIVHETMDLASKHKTETAAFNASQKSTSQPERRITEKPKFNDKSSSVESEKCFEVKIVEMIEISECDESQNPSSDIRKEKKNSSVNGADLSRKSSVGQISKIETPKSTNQKNYPAIVSVKESPNIRNILDSNNTPKIAKSTEKSISSPPKNISPKLNNVPVVIEAATSPDIEIVETLQSSRSENFIEPQESSTKSSPRTSGTTSKIMKPQNLDDAETKSKNEHREEKDVTKTRNKIVSPLKTDTFEITSEICNPDGDDLKIDENLATDKSKATKLPVIKSCDTVTKRITPTTLASSIEFNTPKSNRKVSGIKNDESPKSSRSKEKAKPKEIFEPVAGCSKTPDEMFFMKKLKEKNKSLPDESFMMKPWMPSMNDESSENSDTPKSKEKDENFDKPHLIVKTIKPVVSHNQDTFAMFLGLCLQTNRDEAMEKIVAKLKRHYEQLDPEYARSREFNDFLNKKREKIIAKGRIYYYIGHIFEEMKMRRRGKYRKIEENNKSNNEVESSEDENEEENSEEAARLKGKIKTIQKAMKQCSKKIQKLEIAEVNFDDEDDSDYIKLQRYKQRMVELYTKMCEYTNEHADAGRAYLRPKHLRVTQIPSIDQAINSFINSKLSNGRKKIAKGQSFVDGLIFPDYVDILECVGKVNDQQNLGLDKRRQQKLAQEAFTQLGKHLQDARQKDYWDTFSLALENDEDPAAKDPSLSEKLLQNQEIAEKNTKAIFEQYVRKQEETNALTGESSNSSKDDNDEDEDEDEDNKQSSNNDAPNELAISDDENGESVDKNKEDDNLPDILELIPEDEEQSEIICEKTVQVTNNVNDDSLANSMEKINVPEKLSKEPTEIPIDIEAIHENEETIIEAPNPREKNVEDMEDQVPEVRIDDKTNENNNVPVIIEAKIDHEVTPTKNERIEISNDKETVDIQVKCAKADKEDPMKPAIDETMKNEVNHDEADANRAIDPLAEQPTRALRIRSFAKPPSSWASSQEMTLEIMDVSPISNPATRNNETLNVIDEKTSDSSSACTTSITEVSVSPRILRITRSIPPNSKDNASTRMPKILPKIVPATKQQRPMNKCPSIIIAPQNSSSFNQSSSKLTKIVPNQDLKKQITILPGVAIRPSNSQAQQNTFRQTSLTNSTIGTVRALNVPQNIRLAANPQNPVNVRVRALNIPPQSIQVRLGKNLRPAQSDQVQVVRLANSNDFARTNGIRVSPSLQPRSLIDHSANQVFRMPVPQTLQSNPLTAGQHVGIRVAGNGQISQASQQQQQILRLSNGQLMRASTATIRPLSSASAHVHGITLKNPRFIRLPAGNNAASSVVSPAAAATRLPDNGQLRIEKIENLPKGHEEKRLSSSNTDDSSARSSITPIEQRTNPVLKPNTSNNTPFNDNQRRYRGKRPGHKNFCTVTNSSEPPPKK